MTLTWQRDELPVWDADKARVIGGAPQGAFVIPFHEGDALPGEWFVARDGDEVVGYGRLDIGWGGDAEILLAVDGAAQQRGVGSFVLARLEDEAAARGLNYVYNTVRSSHPRRDDLHDWLAVRGYRGSSSDTTLRKRVGADRQRPTPDADAAGAQPAASRTAGGGPSYDPASEGERAPGHEESGGYVDVEDHRY